MTIRAQPLQICGFIVGAVFVSVMNLKNLRVLVVSAFTASLSWSSQILDSWSPSVGRLSAFSRAKLGCSSKRKWDLKNRGAYGAYCGGQDIPNLPRGAAGPATEYAVILSHLGRLSGHLSSALNARPLYSGSFVEDRVLLVSLANRATIGAKSPRLASRPSAKLLTAPFTGFSWTSPGLLGEFA